MAFTAASSEMLGDEDSADKPASEEDGTGGAPKRRCIQRFSREPGWAWKLRDERALGTVGKFVEESFHF